MKNFLCITAMLCLSYTAWAQPTSYGNLNQGNAGDNGNNTNSYFGYNAGLNNTVTSNTFMGYQSGLNNTTGPSNVFIGRGSGYNNTTGYTNTFIGRDSGHHNINGLTNTFLGAYSGYNNNGDSNTFIGNNSGYNNINGYSNTFTGRNSGYFNATGHNNVFLGGSSGYDNSSGSYNTYLGYGSGSDNTDGWFNVFIGSESGRLNTIGDNNTFIGRQSGYNNETGSANVFLGYRAGYNELGSDFLYIDNSDTASPLIWGDFANDLLRFNGSVRIVTMPQDDALSRILVANIDGDIYWRDAVSVGDGFEDADADPNNEIQTLNYDPGTQVLSISSGNNVDLSGLGGADNLGDHQVLQDLLPDSDNSYNLGGNGNGFGSIYFDNALFINDTEFLHTRDNNIAIGNNALAVAAGSSQNTAVGNNALATNGFGSLNTAIGFGAMENNTGGNTNVALGHQTLVNNTTGSGNIAVGYLALTSNTTGTANTAVGYSAGPSFNVIAPVNNSTAIGNGATVTASGQVRVGDVFVASIGGFQNWSNLSDSRFKKDIKEDVSGLDFIKQLRPVSYQLDRDQLNRFLKGEDPKIPVDLSTARTVGFIAQEVEALIREQDYVFTGVEAPQNDWDHYRIRYAEFVVPLVKGMQEQQQIIESLQQEVAALKDLIHGAHKTQPNSNAQTKSTDSFQGFMLYQNTPNPFDKTTVISALIPKHVQQAKIIVYNLQGLELESYELSKRGHVSVEISAGRFPSGMYLYALIADDHIIDTKKMILTR